MTTTFEGEDFALGSAELINSEVFKKRKRVRDSARRGLHALDGRRRRLARGGRLLVLLLAERRGATSLDSGGVIVVVLILFLDFYI